MFTGIIECLGTIRSITRGDRSALIAVKPDNPDFSAVPGDSVAINGVCLTLESHSHDLFAFRAVAETLARTTLGALAAGNAVNLERALKVDGRLGGHFVLGHVDCIAAIAHDKKQGDSLVRTFEVPEGYARFIAEKGSIAIDGISLTVMTAVKNEFTVSFIPVTIARTTMALKKTGDDVNIEIDVLARYIAKLLEHGNGDRTETAGSPAESLYRKLERLDY